MRVGLPLRVPMDALRQGLLRSSPSDDDGAAVEPAEAETGEGLVVQPLMVAQETNGDLLAEVHSLLTIGPPMHAGGITTKGDVGGELIEFASHGQRCSVRKE